MPERPQPTLAAIAQAFGLLGQPPYVSQLAQQRAQAQASAQARPPSAFVRQQQALLSGVLAQLAPQGLADQP